MDDIVVYENAKVRGRERERGVVVDLCGSGSDGLGGSDSL